jgi:hypothetical protein
LTVFGARISFNESSKAGTAKAKTLSSGNGAGEDKKGRQLKMEILNLLDPSIGHLPVTSPSYYTTQKVQGLL